MKIIIYSESPEALNPAWETFRSHVQERFPKISFETAEDYHTLSGLLAKQFCDVICFDTGKLPEDCVRERLERIRAAHPESVRILLADDLKYALYGYSVGLFDYLLKPLDPVQLEHTFVRVLRERYGDALEGFRVKVKGGWRLLRLQDIVYLETFNHHLIYHMADGQEIRQMGKLRDIGMELSCCPALFQCHKSYVVNGNYVTGMTETSFLVGDGKKISISRPYRKAARRFYAGCSE